MINEPDALLTRLFAEQSPPAHGPEFVAQVMSVLEREQRKRRTYHIGMMIAGVIAAALLAPWIAQFAATAIGSMAAGISAAHSILNLPLAWLMVCSVAAGFLPAIYLGITRRW